MQHDGIIDRIVAAAEAKVGSDDALPGDRVLAVIAAYHREEYHQGEEMLKELRLLNKNLGNGNGRRRWRDRMKSAAVPVVGGGSLASLVLLALVEKLGG